MDFAARDASPMLIGLEQPAFDDEDYIYEWKLDYDDNRPEYEGKIIYGNMEYEFTIDANTGEILEWDMDSVYD